MFRSSAVVTFRFEGRVCDAEPVVQQRAGAVGEFLGTVQIGAVVHLEVRRERRCRRVDRPDVEVVDRPDARHVGQGSGHFCRVDARGCCFEQHHDRVLHQSPDAGEDEYGDEDRGCGVGPIGIEEVDAASGDDHAERAECVSHEVPERGADVQVRSSAAAEEPGTAAVDRQTDESDHRERCGIEDLGAREPADGFDDDPSGEGHQDGPVEQCGQDLGASQPVALA